MEKTARVRVGAPPDTLRECLAAECPGAKPAECPVSHLRKCGVSGFTPAKLRSVCERRGGAAGGSPGMRSKPRKRSISSYLARAPEPPFSLLLLLGASVFYPFIMIII